ncbi:hypothetical protein ACQ4N7_01710 [Nodosilinea sp. AN01ver1]|uniref:hypothetical protein n=1 Tax=Nodosilinea sp. AN01ver1 TaxID=3423362 RepID=UPI003D31DF47
MANLPARETINHPVAYAQTSQRRILLDNFDVFLNQYELTPPLQQQGQFVWNADFGSLDGRSPL